MKAQVEEKVHLLKRMALPVWEHIRSEHPEIALRLEYARRYRRLPRWAKLSTFIDFRRITTQWRRTRSARNQALLLSRNTFWEYHVIAIARTRCIVTSRHPRDAGIILRPRCFAAS
jgi:hypothetical protein